MPPNQCPKTAEERRKTISILRRRIRAKERQGRKEKPATTGRRDGWCEGSLAEASDVDAPIVPTDSTSVKPAP